MWSDPNDKIEGFDISPRGSGYLFGSKLIIDQKRQQDHINYVLRDTQYIKKEHFDKTVLTVWSAPNYCYRFGNKATVLILEKNSYKFFEFSLSMENKEIQETLKISIEKNKYFN